MKIDIDTFDTYLRYYKSIEKMFINTIQYVSPSLPNQYTYSDEYTKIILLCGSEIDSVLKYICILNKQIPTNKDYSMVDYSKFLESGFFIDKSYTPTGFVTAKEKNIVAAPYKNISKGAKYAGLEWWRDYQAIKHNRMENAEKGNLKNATLLLVAYYILMLYLEDNLCEEDGSVIIPEERISDILIPCLEGTKKWTNIDG